MKVQELTKAMRNSISEIFETMFFMPLEYEEHKGIEDLVTGIEEPLIGANIGFSGPFIGRLAILLPQGLARELTFNFLGEDESAVTEDMVDGTIKEILNMLAGKMLSLYDPSLVFNLEIPQMTDISLIKGDQTTTKGQNFELFINTVDNTFCMKLTIDN